MGTVCGALRWCTLTSQCSTEYLHLCIFRYTVSLQGNWKMWECKNPVSLKRFILHFTPTMSSATYLYLKSGTLCRQLCALETVPTPSAGTSRLITYRMTYTVSSGTLNPTQLNSTPASVFIYLGTFLPALQIRRLLTLCSLINFIHLLTCLIAYLLIFENIFTIDINLKAVVAYDLLLHLIL